MDNNYRHSVNVFQPPVENNDLNGDTLESVREGLPELVPPDFSSSFSSNTDDSPANTLDLPSGSFLSINWQNMKGGKDFLTVETKKELDTDDEKTAHYQKMSTSMASSSSIASNPSLYDMLAMYCGKCKEHVEATKQLVLYRLPPILIIQLKRFIYTTSVLTVHRRSKDDRSVRYPIDNLDLAQYLADTAPSGQVSISDFSRFFDFFFWHLCSS
ncbi:unnamed protein product [Gongylonema pulchrum]|uniref:ubiquitinyl hydrolase 1 n=1 Tax=Gongylonema pulchrum TaxID=637853 RepID=A0A183E5U5_9BILA|nr:unnamed protein product [Gongylonema pulchrum]